MQCKKFYFTGFRTHEKKIKGKEGEDDLISILRKPVASAEEAGQDDSAN